jgi:hypothetical protein
MPYLTEQQAHEAYPGPTEFVHLHNHTLFSILDGVAQPEAYFKGCAERKWPAFAITEHGVMNSVPDAYFAAKDYKVKYIVGNEIYYNDFELIRREFVASGSKLKSLKESNPDLESRMRRNRHLTVLCKNMQGYENLLKINKYAYENGFYYRPRVWFDSLAKHSEGLIILSGCLNGPVCHELRSNNFSSKDKHKLGAIEYVRRFSEVFKDNYYIELQMPGIPGDVEVMAQLIAIADRYKIKTVLANDCWNPDVPVLTNKGVKPINKIQIGDMVWTHRGRWREVVGIGKRKIKHDEQLYGFYGGKLIYCTGNHKVFARTNSNKKPNFIAVEDLSENDFICVTGMKLQKHDLKTIRLSDYINSNRLVVKNGKVYPYRWNKRPVQDEYVLTDDILYMIGCYVAEGNSDGHRLSFASHKREQTVRNLIIKFFKELGFSPQTKKISENGYSVRVCCSAWTYFLKDCCGEGKHNKHLPPFWTKLSERQLKVLLRGYLDGDGCHSRRVSFSVSRYLFSDLQHAFASLGLEISGWLRKPKQVVFCHKKDGRKVKTKSSEGYYILYPKPTYSALGYDIGNYDNSKRRSKTFFDEYGMWIINPFNHIGHIDGDVWCIQVDEDASFCVGITSSNCHYLTRKDYELQTIMMAIDQDTTIDDPELFHVNSSEQFFKTRAELRATFNTGGYSELIGSDIFERSCDTTLEIADKCDGFKPNLEPKLPKIQDAENEMVRLALEGLRQKGLDKDKKRYLTMDGIEVTYMEQMQTELERFIDKGYASYFLITRDLIKCSTDRGWPIGPARGSAGGSLVCFLMGIHSLDPIKWGLSFNRFLSPARGGKALNIMMPKKSA